MNRYQVPKIATVGINFCVHPDAAGIAADRPLSLTELDVRVNQSLGRAVGNRQYRDAKWQRGFSQHGFLDKE
jgi:hypothetical protein